MPAVKNSRIKQAVHNTCVIFLEGEVSARNVPELQGGLDEILAAHPGEELVFEARDLTYISSAGLRMLLGVQKKLGNKKLVIRNVSKAVYDIFEMTKTMPAPMSVCSRTVF